MADAPTDNAQNQQRADRIRDNQRRSRERKKQLVEELQARVLQFERVGAEAGQELQKAGRLVAECNKRLRAENSKLRDLLRKLGYTDATIDAYVGTQPDPLPANQAVQTLDLLLNTRHFPDGTSISADSIDRPAGDPHMPASSSRWHPEPPPVQAPSAASDLSRHPSQVYTAAYTLNALHAPQSPSGYAATDGVFQPGLPWGQTGAEAHLPLSSSGASSSIPAPRQDGFRGGRDAGERQALWQHPARPSILYLDGGCR